MDFETPNASEQKEKILPQGEWAEIPRKILVENSSGALSEQEYGETEEKKVYDYNNGVYVIVDKKGQLHAAPRSPKIEEALKTSGYKQSSSTIGVPFSNEELPIMPKLRQQWDLMLEKAEIEERHAEIKKTLEIAETLPEGEWIALPSSLEYKDSQGKEYPAVSLSSEKKDHQTYNMNNGVFSICDVAGKIHVAPATPDRLLALKKAGYKKSGLGVPFSNAETPVDPLMAKQWELLQKEQDEEREKGIQWDKVDTEYGEAWKELYG